MLFRSEVQPEPETEPEVQPEAETEPEVQPEPETEPEVQPEPETEPEVQPEPETEPEVQPEPETEPEVQPEAETEPEVQPEPETEPEVQPEPETEPEVQPEPETEPEVQPETETEPEVQPETETEPEVQPEPETEPEVQPEAETEPEVQPEPEVITETETEELPDQTSIEQKVSELLDTVEREQDLLLHSPTQQILTENLFDALERLELDKDAERTADGLLSHEDAFLPDPETEVPVSEAVLPTEPEIQLEPETEPEVQPEPETMDPADQPERVKEEENGENTPPEDDLGFDFDAVTDALAIDAFEKEDYRYTENNLMEGGKNLLMGDSVTSKFYVNGKEYSYPVFRDVSMLCPEGTCTAVVSDVPFCSYALLRAVAQPFELEEGKFILDGRDIEPSDVLYLGSDRLADRRQTVSVWLADNADGREMTVAKAKTLLEEVGAGDWADIRLTELSSARRMLVILLGAARHSARLVLINDPKFAVTPEDEMIARRIFKRLNDTGKAVLIAAADPFTLQAVSNRVLVLKDGSARFTGSFRDFIEHFAGVSIRVPAAHAQAISDAVQADGRYVLTQKEDETILSLSRPANGTLREMLQTALNAGVPLEEIRTVDKSFEQACMEAVS